MSSQNCKQYESTDEHAFVTRVVATAIDPFHGLKGHEYIKARNLNAPVRRVQTSAHSEKEVCK